MHSSPLKKRDRITNSVVFVTICKHVYKGLIEYLFKYWSFIMTMRNALESAIYIHSWFHPSHNVKWRDDANEWQIFFSLSARNLHRDASGLSRGLDTPAGRPEPGCAAPVRCDGSAEPDPSETCGDRTVRRTRSRAQCAESHSASPGCPPCGSRHQEQGQRRAVYENQGQAGTKASSSSCIYKTFKVELMNDDFIPLLFCLHSIVL